MAINSRLLLCHTPSICLGPKGPSLGNSQSGRLRFSLLAHYLQCHLCSVRVGTKLYISPTTLTRRIVKDIHGLLISFWSDFQCLLTMPIRLACAACSGSFLSHPWANSPGRPALHSFTRRSAHSSFATFLYHAVPQHRQVHSVARQQCDLGANWSRPDRSSRAGFLPSVSTALTSWHLRLRGPGLLSRPGASRPGRTRSLAETSVACFPLRAASPFWSGGHPPPTLAPPHASQGLAVSFALLLSSLLRLQSRQGMSLPALRWAHSLQSLPPSVRGSPSPRLSSSPHCHRRLHCMALVAPSQLSLSLILLLVI